MYTYNQTEFAIGIDVGTSTGLAVWNRKEKIFIEIKTLAIHKALERVKELHTNHKIRVCVEDPRKAKYVPQTEKEKKDAEARAQGAGSIKRDAVIWEDFLNDNGIAYDLVAPNYKLTKLPPATFKKMTKYPGVTSNHGRDAAMLVYGL